MKNEYRCSNCECEFDEPEFICEREVIDYGIGREWITLFEGEVCPYCESMEFEPVCEEESESTVVIDQKDRLRRTISI